MRDLLNESKIDAPAMLAMETFHARTLSEVKEAVAKNRIVIVGMAQNPVVKKAKNLLDQKARDYKYLEYGSYFSMWKPRLAIKLWSGWPTFPQVFIDGKLVGGCHELEALVAAGKV